METDPTTDTPQTQQQQQQQQVGSGPSSGAAASIDSATNGPAGGAATAGGGQTAAAATATAPVSAAGGAAPTHRPVAATGGGEAGVTGAAAPPAAPAAPRPLRGGLQLSLGRLGTIGGGAGGVGGAGAGAGGAGPTSSTRLGSLRDGGAGVTRLRGPLPPASSPTSTALGSPSISINATGLRGYGAGEEGGGAGGALPLPGLGGMGRAGSGELRMMSASERAALAAARTESPAPLVGEDGCLVPGGRVQRPREKRKRVMWPEDDTKLEAVRLFRKVGGGGGRACWLWGGRGGTPCCAPPV